MDKNSGSFRKLTDGRKHEGKVFIYIMYRLRNNAFSPDQILKMLKRFRGFAIFD